MKADVASHKEMLADSEKERAQLQEHITQTSVNVQLDTQKHKEYQTELLDEIERLKAEIERMK